MATNAEQIQTNLAKCNVSLWEPDALSKVQLSACKLQCIENEIDPIVAKITEALAALSDIEDVATGDTGFNDVVFVESTPPTETVWSMTSHTNGSIYFGVNASSEFYAGYVIPGVSTTTVPVEADVGNGLEPRSADDIYQDRVAALQSQTEVMEATINGLANYKALIILKKDSLAAEYL